MPADQDTLEPILHQLLAGPRNCVDAGLKGVCDLAVAASLASLGGVRLQQNARLRQLPRRVFAHMDQGVEPPSLFRAELDDVFFDGNPFRDRDASPAVLSHRFGD
jgi:hypothetical protein